MLHLAWEVPTLYADQFLTPLVVLIMYKEYHSRKAMSIEKMGVAPTSSFFGLLARLSGLFAVLWMRRQLTAQGGVSARLHEFARPDVEACREVRVSLDRALNDPPLQHVAVQTVIEREA